MDAKLIDTLNVLAAFKGVLDPFPEFGANVYEGAHYLGFAFMRGI